MLFKSETNDLDTFISKLCWYPICCNVLNILNALHFDFSCVVTLFLHSTIGLITKMCPKKGFYYILLLRAIDRLKLRKTRHTHTYTHTNAVCYLRSYYLVVITFVVIK